MLKKLEANSGKPMNVIWFKTLYENEDGTADLAFMKAFVEDLDGATASVHLTKIDDTRIAHLPQQVVQLCATYRLTDAQIIWYSNIPGGAA